MDKMIRKFSIHKFLSVILCVAMILTSFSGIGIMKTKKAKAATEEGIFCKGYESYNSFELNGETYFIRIHNKFSIPGKKKLIIDYRLPENWGIYHLTAEQAEARASDDNAACVVGDDQEHDNISIDIPPVDSQTGRYCLVASESTYNVEDNTWENTISTDTCYTYFYDDYQKPVVNKFEMGSEFNEIAYVNEYQDGRLINVPDNFYEKADVNELSYMLKHTTATFEIGDNDDYGRNTKIYYCVTKSSTPPDKTSTVWKETNIPNANSSIVVKASLSSLATLKTDSDLIGNWYVHVMDGAGLQNTSSAVHIGKLLYQYLKTSDAASLTTDTYYGVQGDRKSLANQEERVGADYIGFNQDDGTATRDDEGTYYYMGSQDVQKISPRYKWHQYSIQFSGEMPSQMTCIGGETKQLSSANDTYYYNNRYLCRFPTLDRTEIKRIELNNTTCSRTLKGEIKFYPDENTQGTPLSEVTITQNTDTMITVPSGAKYMLFYNLRTDNTEPVTLRMISEDLTEEKYVYGDDYVKYQDGTESKLGETFLGTIEVTGEDTKTLDYTFHQNRKGSLHAGYNLSGGGTGVEVTGKSDDVHVKRVFSPNTYKVFLDYHKPDKASGTLEMDKDVKEVNAVYGGKMTELSGIEPRLKGWTFDGWYDSQGIRYTEDSVYELAEETKLTARWSQKTYKIAYALDYTEEEYISKGYTTNIVGTQEMTYDEEEKLWSCAPELRKGASFTGWSKDINGVQVYEKGETVKNIVDTSDDDMITLYAVYTPTKTKYMIHANNPSKSGHNVEASFTDDELKDIWTLEAESDSESISKDNFYRGYATYPYGEVYKLPKLSVWGWEFDGYKLPSDHWRNLEQSAKNESTEKQITGTATWSRLQYNIEFNANCSESELAGSVGATYTQKVRYDMTEALMSNQFVRKNYKFAGWSTAKDGDVEYTNCADVYNLSDTGKAGAKIQLYAIWRQAATSYTVNVFRQENATDSTGKVSNSKLEYKKVNKYSYSNGCDVGDEIVLKEGDGLPNLKGYSINQTAGTALKQTVEDTTEEVTFNVYYDRDKYSVTYDLDPDKSGKVVDNKTDYENNPIEWGITKTLDYPIPYRYGYSFIGWSYQDKIVDSLTMPQEDVLVKAVWEKTPEQMTLTDIMRKNHSLVFVYNAKYQENKHYTATTKADNVTTYDTEDGQITVEETENDIAYIENISWYYGGFRVTHTTKKDEQDSSESNMATPKPDAALIAVNVTEDDKIKLIYSDDTYVLSGYEEKELKSDGVTTKYTLKDQRYVEVTSTLDEANGVIIHRAILYDQSDAEAARGTWIEKYAGSGDNIETSEIAEEISIVDDVILIGYSDGTIKRQIAKSKNIQSDTVIRYDFSDGNYVTKTVTKEEGEYQYLTVKMFDSLNNEIVSSSYRIVGGSTGSKPEETGEPDSPGVSRKPDSGESGVPSASRVPSASKAPSVSEEPGASRVPSASKDPSESKAPGVPEVPSTSKVPIASKAPSVSEKPNSGETGAPGTSDSPKYSNNPDVTKITVTDLTLINDIITLYYSNNTNKSVGYGSKETEGDGVIYVLNSDLGILTYTETTKGTSVTEHFVYTNNAGVLLFEKTVITTVTTKEDGSTETKTDAIRKDENGTTATTDKTETVDKDGNKLETTKDTDKDGNTTTTVTNIDRDGNKTETVTKPDGSRTEIVTKTDGSKTETITDKEGKTTKTETDKTGVITTTYPDGAVTEIRKDGTTVTKGTDGSVTTKYPDGTITVVSSTGVVTTIKADGTKTVLDPNTKQETPKEIATVVVGGVTYQIKGKNVSAVKVSNKKLKTVKIPAKVKIGKETYNVTEIGANIFQNCKSLKSVTFGGTILKIKSGAFRGCKSLKTINIKKVTKLSISAGAFKGCGKIAFKVNRKAKKALTKVLKVAKVKKFVMK